jgi:hypothetical protein
MKKTISISILLTLVFSGCTLKENDSSVERGIKHTINAPGYVVLGVGALGTAVMMAPFIAVGKGVQVHQPIYSYSQPVNIRTVKIEKSLSV